MDLAQSVDAVKMNVLPRLLYLFQSIPSEVPMNILQEIDKTVSRFIWQGKKPRDTTIGKKTKGAFVSGFSKVFPGSPNKSPH